MCQIINLLKILKIIFSRDLNYTALTVGQNTYYHYLINKKTSIFEIGIKQKKSMNIYISIYYVDQNTNNL